MKRVDIISGLADVSECVYNRVITSTAVRDYGCTSRVHTLTHCMLQRYTVVPDMLNITLRQLQAPNCGGADSPGVECVGTVVSTASMQAGTVLNLQ